jgi:gliding motility-associated-like protein
MKNKLYICLLSIIPLWAFSQQNPTLTCLDVDENGDVTVHWLPPSAPAELKSYDIFYNNGTGYVQLGSTAAGQLSFTHTGAQADAQSQFYYVEAVYPTASYASETIQTIFLQVAVSPDFDEATLYWNSPSSPFPEGSNSLYFIYMEDNSDNWIIIDSIAAEPYKKKVYVCDDWVNFMVVLSNINGCVSRSNIGGEQFKDIILPEKPIFDSVSINYFNNIPRIVLGWQASSSEDAIGYILYRQQDISFFEFDTVYNINTTFYIDTLVQACDTIHTYAIAAIDSCGNKSPGTFSNALQNIRIYDVVYDPCMLEAIITFEPFIDYEADSITFELVGNSSAGFRQVKKMNTVLYQENLSSLRSANDIITVIDDDLRVGRVYDYYIREKVFKGNNYYTTSSCIKSIYAYGYEKPTYSYFVNADVLPNNQVELTIDYDTVIKNSFLQVWRSDPGEEFLNYLTAISVDTLTDNPISMTDITADGSQGFYLYGIKILDSCSKKVLESNRLKTMGLSVVVKDRDHNWLRWNRFEGWKAGVAKYYIYRKDGNLEPTAPVDSVYWYENEYIDDISNLNSAVENLVYWVQAVERDGNDFGFKEISHSNRAVVIPESDIFFPNAFKPGGTEEFFKPIFRFLGGSNYLFQIYNRWGQLIFETTDPYSGWDGTYKGLYVVQGTYIFKFQYLDVYSDSFHQQGTVTVFY